MRVATAALPPPHATRPWAAMLAALGVVYGDIGTSPLYATRECFDTVHGVTAVPENVLGVLSLIIWSLIWVISIKYLWVILRADNEGEGGILALMALVGTHRRCGDEKRLGHGWLTLVGLFGAALLYGDGAITPAISVLSAIEGVAVAAPAATPFVLPLTLLVLLALFAVQRRGTAQMGAVFGPVTLAWFVTIGALGVHSIARTPAVLAACSPLHAWRFFAAHGPRGVLILGAIFLAVTGGEALYADMGHFGRRPIRHAWLGVALPALVLNYLGQGALLLRDPTLADSPFYRLAPGWMLVPLVVLATCATVIASQAVITGAFSLTWQAVQLGFLPRVAVRHTSASEMGQVYLPTVNAALCCVTLALVLHFRTSSALASAYGIAVTMTMGITSLLALQVMRQVWGWPWLAALGLTAAFLAVDLAFFCANIVKVADGGWVPLSMGLVILLVMTTWSTGRQILGQRLASNSVPLDHLGDRLRLLMPLRTPGCAIFMTSALQAVPASLMRLLQHLHAMPEHVIILTVQTVRAPEVAEDARLTIEDLAPQIWRVVVRVGFMERPQLPDVARRLAARGVPPQAMPVFYVLGRETLLASDAPGMALWRERLFAVMARNASRAMDFYGVPAAQVLEIGAQIDL